MSCKFVTSDLNQYAIWFWLWSKASVKMALYANNYWQIATKYIFHGFWYQIRLLTELEFPTVQFLLYSTCLLHCFSHKKFYYVENVYSKQN